MDGEGDELFQELPCLESRGSHSTEVVGGELFQELPCLESRGSHSTEVVGQRDSPPEKQVCAQLRLLADVSDNSSGDMVSDNETAADELRLEVIPAVPDQAPIVEIRAVNDPQGFLLLWRTPLHEFLTCGDGVDLSGTCRAAWFVVQDF